jgi:hypothetical protein
MRIHMRNALAVLAAASLAVSGCGGAEDEPAVDETLPAAEVASLLVTADDLEGEWVLSGDEVSESGVVTEEAAEEIPTLELCDSASAEARAASEGLRWQAFRHLDKTVDDPVEPPEDMSGRMVFAQEFLLSDDPGDIESTFDALKSGLDACMGQSTENEDGSTGTSEPWPVPDVGDDRLGVLETVSEPGGDGTWLLYSALVRDGSVLMVGLVAEAFLGEGVTAELGADEIDQVITTMAQKIG